MITTMSVSHAIARFVAEDLQTPSLLASAQARL